MAVNVLLFFTISAIIVMVWTSLFYRNRVIIKTSQWCEHAFIIQKLPTGCSELNQHGQTEPEMAEKYVNAYPATVAGPGGWRAGSLPLSGRPGTCRSHYW